MKSSNRLKPACWPSGVDMKTEPKISIEDRVLPDDPLFSSPNLPFAIEFEVKHQSRRY